MRSRRERRAPRWYLYAVGNTEQPQPWERVRALPSSARVSADGYWADHQGEVYLNLGEPLSPIRADWGMAA